MKSMIPGSVLFAMLMEAAQSDAAAGASAPSGKPAQKREVEKVRMQDGREVEFAGKSKMLKEALIRLPDSSYKSLDDATQEELNQTPIENVAIRMDFRNGATRTYHANPALTHRKVAHGMLQKYGDNLAAGVKKADGTQSDDLDDWALESDALHEQIQKGEWSKVRVGGGGGGMSVLLQALMEFTGRTADEVKDHIKDWTPAQKQQLRMDPEIKPIVDRIEQEKAAKTSHVDTGALKAGLKSLGAAPAA